MQWHISLALILSFLVGTQMLLGAFSVKTVILDAPQEKAQNFKLDTTSCASGSTDPRMNPTFDVYEGQGVVWQIPPNPKAVLFLAHGGFSSVLNFFDPGPGCKLCIGRPVDRAIVLDALGRGYAVIAFQSTVPTWDMAEIESSKDLKIVTSLINTWTKEHSLEGLPLVAWGHSAGGIFVTLLAWKIRLQALVVMCAWGNRGAIVLATPDRFPPTMFVHMAKDVSRVRHVHMDMRTLTENGVSVFERLCYPQQIFPHFFSERIRCLSKSDSEKLYYVLVDASWLDRENYLIVNPAGDVDLQPIFNTTLIVYNGLQEAGCLREDFVRQELELAYALHTWTNEVDDGIFNWFDSTILSDEPSPWITRVQSIQ